MTFAVLQIKGNHDRQLVNQNPEDHGLSDKYAFPLLNGSELSWLRMLPASAEVQNELLLFHGTPSSDKTYLLESVEHGRARLATQDEISKRLGETKQRVLLCGHTHIPRVVEMPENILIVNPGSVGLPAYDDEFPEYHVMETGSPHARYAILEYKDGNWLPEMIAIPYDHEKAAEQARKNGRPDWDIGLRTGFMHPR